MSDVAVRVENLGKKYVIGHQKSGDLRASVAKKFQNLFSRNGTTHEEFWALKDVSFEVRKGEAVGIIGRNGAGKSTLLKLLSRITDPTTGRFEINGRVSSLLEVGTGFHPELSGRENIFLNGTILGMRRTEIKAKFDEIVDFSGVEKFIDTPVKHYSSGMKVRLAFSVAAHLEPEILIVDEVLAVGDAEFQKKCLGKMDEVSKSEGRTVLFVSHNMAAVEYLCTNGILMELGCTAFKGNLSDVLSKYSSLFESKNDHHAKGDKLEVLKFEILNSECTRSSQVISGEDLIIAMTLKNISGDDLDNIRIAIGISDSHGVRMMQIDSFLKNVHFSVNRAEVNDRIKFIVTNTALKRGLYHATLYIARRDSPLVWLKNFYSFTVFEGDFFKTGRLPKDGQYQFLAPFEIQS